MFHCLQLWWNIELVFVGRTQSRHIYWNGCCGCCAHLTRLRIVATRTFHAIELPFHHRSPIFIQFVVTTLFAPSQRVSFLFPVTTFFLFFFDKLLLFLDLIFKMTTIRLNILVDLDTITVVAVFKLAILTSQTALPLMLLGMWSGRFDLDDGDVLYGAIWLA